MKTCFKCNQTFPLSGFLKDSSKKDGLRGECTICRRAYKAQWRRDNPLSFQNSITKVRDRIKEAKRPLREAREKAIQARKETKEKEKATKQELNKTHKLCKSCNQWLDRIKGFNKDVSKSHGRASCCRLCRASTTIRTRGKRVEREEDITPEKVWEAYRLFRFKCYKCHSTNDLSLDHHDAKYKLTSSNAVVLCKACNSSKHNKPANVFYNNQELRVLRILLGIKG